jgi:hypothetical protein
VNYRKNKNKLQALKWAFGVDQQEHRREKVRNEIIREQEVLERTNSPTFPT